MRHVVGPIWVLVAFYVTPCAAFSDSHPPEEDEHRNEVALFVGGTTETLHDKTFLTIGGEYEIRLHPRFGASLAIEYVPPTDTGVVAFPVVFHGHRGWALFVGPGWESSPRRGEEHNASKATRDSREKYFLLRTGVQYGFRVGSRVSIFPGIDVDFVNEREGWETLVVYGAKIAVGF
jgi:hypothetical protein